MDSRCVKTNLSVELINNKGRIVADMKDLSEFGNYLDNVENYWLNGHLNRNKLQLQFIMFGVVPQFAIDFYVILYSLHSTVDC